MPEFQVGDIVRVEMPRGYSMRGVLGISLLFSTSPESRFEGAIGTVTEINPLGSHGVHQYLVDFRTHDNGRIGIPWQAQWFREEWLALQERPEAVAAAQAARTGPEATWPSRAESEAGGTATIAHPEAKLFTEGKTDFAPRNEGSGDESRPAPGIAHPDAKIFKEGRKEFAPPGVDPETITGKVPDSAYGISSVTEGERSTGDRSEGLTPGARDASLGFSGTDRADDRSGADVPAFEPTPETMNRPVDATTPSSAPGTMDVGETARLPSDAIVEQGEGFVRVQGMTVCPDGFPIKGNSKSGVFHAPTDSTYEKTIPEFCFASEEAAILNGYRAPVRRGSSS